MRRKYKILIIIGLLILVVAALAFYLAHHNVAVLNPKGTIAQKQQHLMIFGALLSLIVIVPVYAMTILFAWRYRAGNHHAKYSPEMDRHWLAETVWWLVPGILIGILSVITWQSSHQLDPFRPLDSPRPAMTIQVVALDWKWLFIYPEQNIASVNFVEMPVGQSVDFAITADAPMNSFWIPQLGGQIYAMSGMVTHLHLQANQTGDYRGSSANISGDGFAGMRFTARAASQTDFNRWVTAAKRSPQKLSLAKYRQLAQPSQYDPVETFAAADRNLYNSILLKYLAPGSPLESRT